MYTKNAPYLSFNVIYYLVAVGCVDISVAAAKYKDGKDGYFNKHKTCKGYFV
jgi:hypothetical protein